MSRGPLAGLLAALALLMALGPGPAAQPTGIRAGPGRTSGPPGALWGRLAVEEESPDGPWTPLSGVEVTLYPYAAELAADLDQIRRRARDSGAAYDAALGQVQDRLKAYAARLDASTGDAPGQPGPGGLVRRLVTDPAGLFVFDNLPPGDWLVVALRVSEYTSPRAQRESPRRPPAPGREPAFVPRPAKPAKQAEVWVARVRVEPEERVRLWLTDRSRYMVGPIR
jgi:hypothetical protein